MVYIFDFWFRGILALIAGRDTWLQWTALISFILGYFPLLGAEATYHATVFVPGLTLMFVPAAIWSICYSITAIVLNGFVYNNLKEIYN